ncbi:MAG: hypothetical protein ACFE9L_17545 [Candidatus Hodarchaeota archaeon]
MKRSRKSLEKWIRFRIFGNITISIFMIQKQKLIFYLVKRKITDYSTIPAWIYELDVNARKIALDWYEHFNHFEITYSNLKNFYYDVLSQYTENKTSREYVYLGRWLEFMESKYYYLLYYNPQGQRKLSHLNRPRHKSWRIHDKDAEILCDWNKEYMIDNDRSNTYAKHDLCQICETNEIRFYEVTLEMLKSIMDDVEEK